MRVLIVAPNVGNMRPLATNIEIDAIAPEHDTDIVSGDVSQSRLMSRAERQHYDVIHFLAHGSESGIHLTDGVMAPREMAQLARHTRAKLIFLNACSSTIPGQYLVDNGIPAVIVQNHDVEDKDAVRIASYFYNELTVNNSDLRKAYDVANPHDGTLSWLSNGNYRDMLTGEVAGLKKGFVLLTVAVIGHAVLTAGLWLYLVLH